MNYIPQLTFLRFIAAVIVVIFHYAPVAVISPLFTAPLAISAVSFFFFLSGTVLAYNYYGKEYIKFKEFMWKRLARIYPVYLLAALSTLILGMLLNNTFPKGLSVILQILGIHAWIPGWSSGLNYPSWTVSVEFFFYSLFPLIVRFLKKLSRKWEVGFVLILWIISFLQHSFFTSMLDGEQGTSFHDFTIHFPLWHLNIFVFGILCGKYLKDRVRSDQNRFLQSRFMYLVGIIILLAALYLPNPFSTVLYNGLLSPLFYLIIFGFATDNSILTRLFSHKTFILLGNASYGLYILQWPFFILYTKLVGTKALNLNQFVVYLTLLVLVSVLIYKTLEKSAQNFIYTKFISK